MALLLLIVVGLSVGWFASIMMRTESPRAILAQMFAALVASLAAGLYMNSGTIIGSISWMALGSAVAGALVILALYHAVFTLRI